MSKSVKHSGEITPTVAIYKVLLTASELKFPICDEYSLKIRRLQNGKCIITDDFNCIVKDNKGTVITSMADYETNALPLEVALRMITAIRHYFANPLPKEDIQAWLKTLAEENPGDRKVMEKVGRLLLEGKHKQARARWSRADTFVRDGFSTRFMFEMSKPDRLQKKQKDGRSRR